jgi:hypothetical protein
MVGSPTLRRDGTVLDVGGGVDLTTCLLYVPSVEQAEAAEHSSLPGPRTRTGAFGF